MGPAEVLKLHEVSVKEFQTLVATGEVKHVAGLAAWARWMSREDEKYWKIMDWCLITRINIRKIMYPGGTVSM